MTPVVRYEVGKEFELAKRRNGCHCDRIGGCRKDKKSCGNWDNADSTSNK